MSRIGKMPVIIPAGVTVEIKGRVIAVKGPKGELSAKMPGKITFKIEDNQIVFSCPDPNQKNFFGLARTLTDNMVVGTSTGFSKKLEINGVGYKAALKGKDLVLNLGFSHPVKLVPPAGIEVAVDEKENTITISGFDRQAVGEFTAKIRSFRKPEPYKGKGIKYENEHIVRKEGKKAASGE
ncbi:MAG: 50S ribosomal protein L6 [Candidatus Gracilibacteria bacterium]|nr:50S ribosomal protein L6 [Candidatus Gracilibacteria bacterium]